MFVLDHAAQSMWSGVNLALSAVNLGDAAGDMLPKDKLAEIYALAAMTIRLFFPVRCHFMAVSKHNEKLTMCNFFVLNLRRFEVFVFLASYMLCSSFFKLPYIVLHILYQILSASLCQF